jgi:lysine 2,3-aminomutase
VFGQVPEELFEDLMTLPKEPERIIENIAHIRAKADLPFLATDRNVLNLPGVGKSLTFRVIGITRYGRRILEFDHDTTRTHSPIVERMGKVIVIESKSVSEYLRHLEEMGEEVAEYQDVYGYSIGITEPRMPLYEYPDYDFDVTDEITNLDLAAVD